MVNRRSVLKIGAATLAAPLAKVTAFGDDSQARCLFQRAVFDGRFAECRVFAAELSNAGVPTSVIRGDVAALWYGDLRVQLLSEYRAPVAGMTNRAALFCLEELARDVGMKVVFRVDRVIEKDRDPNQATEIGRTLARLISRFDSKAPPDASAQKRTGPFSPANAIALASWIIA